MTEVLRDAVDDPTGLWSEGWKSRVRPVRERFDDLQALLIECECLHDRMEFLGVKLT